MNEVILCLFLFLCCLPYLKRLNSKYQGAKLFHALVFTILLMNWSLDGKSQVVINEVMMKPFSPNNTDDQSIFNPNNLNAGREYVELYNTSCKPVDISCYKIGNNTSQTGTGGNSGFSNGGTFVFPTGTIIPPNSHIVIGGPQASSTPGSVDIVLSNFIGTPNLCTVGKGRWFLENSDGWMALYDTTGAVVDAVYWTFNPNSAAKIDDPNNQYYSSAPCTPNGSTCPSFTPLLSARNIPRNKILYAGEVPSTNLTLSRIPDGGPWKRNINPSIAGSNCNGGTCFSVLDLSIDTVKLCPGGTVSLLAKNPSLISQTPLAKTTNTINVENSPTFGAAITASIPNLPLGAIVDSIQTRVSGTRRCGIISEISVQTTPPSDFAPQQISTLIGGTGPATNQINQLFGTWPKNTTNSPSGVWQFQFQRPNCFSSIDIENVSVTITVYYSMPDVIEWYNAEDGGTLIGTGNPFNPVGLPNSGLPNTNTPGIYKFYASNKTRPNCFTEGVVNILTTKLPKVSDTTYCLNATAVPLKATADPGGTLNWYTLSTGGIPGSTAPTPSTNVVGQQFYYVSQTLAGCESPRTEIVVVVEVNDGTSITIPDGVVLNDGEVYNGYTFVAKPADAKISWENSNPSIGLPANGTGNIPSFKAVNTSSTPAVATINVNTQNGDCIGEKDSFSITVLPPVITALGNDRIRQTYLSVYPNPARDLVEVNYSAATASKGEISLLDMQGRRVYSRAVSIAAGENRYELNLSSSGIGAGNYVLKLRSGNTEKQVKIVMLK